MCARRILHNESFSAIIELERSFLLGTHPFNVEINWNDFIDSSVEARSMCAWESTSLASVFWIRPFCAMYMIMYSNNARMLYVKRDKYEKIFVACFVHMCAYDDP